MKPAVCKYLMINFKFTIVLEQTIQNNYFKQLNHSNFTIKFRKFRATLWHLQRCFLGQPLVSAVGCLKKIREEGV